MKKIPFALMCAMLTLIAAVPAYGNVIWPALFVAEGMRSWPVIIAGLIIEFFFLKRYTELSYGGCLLVDAVMNGVSTAVGFFAIPVAGLFGEIMILAPLDALLGTGTFGLFHWVFSCLLTVLCNTALEGLVLRMFKLKGSGIFWWLFAANALSVGICAVGMAAGII